MISDYFRKPKTKKTKPKAPKDIETSQNRRLRVSAAIAAIPIATWNKVTAAANISWVWR